MSHKQEIFSSINPHSIKSYNEGFTLIELIIAITISALLMTSVMVFTGTTLKNNVKSQKMLQLLNSNFTFEQKLIDIVKNSSGSGIVKTGTGFGDYGTGIFIASKSPGLPLGFIGIKTFTGYCDNAGPAATESGTVKKLVIIETSSSTSHTGTTSGYVINKYLSKIEKSGITIIGTGNEGDNISEENALLTELSNPNAIIENAGYLYIADTGNNRILSYEIATKKIKVIADSLNGISSPQDLFFTSGNLYIANTGKGNILSIQDGSDDNSSELRLNFGVTKALSFNEIDFTFDGISFLSEPHLTSDFTFSGMTKSPGDTIITGPSLKYVFTGSQVNLLKGNGYAININSISPAPIDNLSYSVRLDFISGSQITYSDNLPYFTKGDSSIHSNTGNIVSVIAEGIAYPNNITSPSIWDAQITDWSSLLDNGGYKSIQSELPIGDISYNINGKMLTIKYTYYKHYDCLSGKHILKEKVLKKKLD